MTKHDESQRPQPTPSLKARTNAERAGVAGGCVATPPSLTERIQAWLDSGGRDKVRAAVQKAMQQTAERNKARWLDPKRLDERITI